MFYRLQHINVSFNPYKVDYFGELFAKLKANGINSIMLEYGTMFPYESCSEVCKEGGYSKDEISQINQLALENDLEIIPLGISFSHADSILKIEKYTHLNNGSNALDLLNDESFELVMRAADDILELHPETKVIHFGGDEIYNLLKGARSRSYITEHGASAWYIQFVNKIAAACKERGVRPAIWGDMLIRYPQNISELYKSAMVFYWDYWSYAERCPFITIGGGCPDIFVMDNTQVKGDLKKLFFAPTIREIWDIPQGHLEYYKDYLDLDFETNTAKSFPYLRWFKDNGIDAVASILTHPEKGTFLPGFSEKIEHSRGFLNEVQKTKADGFMCCLWEPFWAPMEVCLPGILAAQVLWDNLSINDSELYENIALRMQSYWTADVAEKYFKAGADIETADMLDIAWGRSSFKERFKWFKEAGELDSEISLAKECLINVQNLLSGEWENLPIDSTERLVLEDFAWRAEIEICTCQGLNNYDALLSQGKKLAKRYEDFLRKTYKENCIKAMIEARYQPWIEYINELK